MFPRRILLKEIKRTRNKDGSEDKSAKVIVDIKKMLDDGEPIYEIIKKHFADRCIDDFMGTKTTKGTTLPNWETDGIGSPFEHGLTRTNNGGYM